ncbi:MAG: ParB/RepB/Spo0J family partition protein [Pelagibacteraceae bacterium]
MNDQKKRGLGRGLSALFGDTKEVEVNVNKKNDIGQKMALIGDLKRNELQPRANFDEVKLDELANSIKQSGLIQPIAVREDKLERNKYEIVAGERRWIASQRAGLHQVPITILKLSDNETLEVAILENIQREDLNPIEEAKGYDNLNKKFLYDQDKISKIMSKSRSHISNTIRLLSLPNDVIRLLEEGSLTAGQARPLIGLSNASAIAEEIILKKMSARSVETLVKAKKKLSSKKTDRDSNLMEIQNQIEQKIGLKVTISNKKNNSGKISIEYKDLDQFELISNLLKS